MQIFRHFEHLPAAGRGASIAIGNFDGVHRGHQALLARAKEEGKKVGAKLGALIFEPHPQEFFKPDGPRFRLTPFRAKARLLENYGTDILYALHFDKALASLTAEQFVEKVLIEGLRVRHIVVGADFQFGKGRTGNVQLLKALSAPHGFSVTEFEPVGAGSEHKISSTRIRELLHEGKPDEAARLLGHWWTVEGRVEHGDARGRTLGFPTANVSLEGTLEPALGIYAVRVEVAGRRYGGAANYGRRPTFDKKDVLLEVHIFDFNADIYGQQIVVEFVSFLRPELKFASAEELTIQIAADCEEAKRVLARTRDTAPPL
jgi:riboflavin kinase/FMN adenylyltransferase